MIPATLFGGHHFLSVSNYSPDGHERTLTNHCDDAILKVQEWIEANYALDLTIESMGREVGMTERTLKRRFRLATRLSPNVYLQKVRIDKAKKLLLATDLSIKAIAYEVGYENVSFFVKIFKTHVGQTPALWRKSGVV
ncbi:helix-turn-helix domain-containing protein [Dechloromonas sp. ARDL1]|uniref:helix-turn-helix domain-containing protein n=1 Tax=Dechloromonas sp. ARDL1 TaxID=3322121 RepID=UPI003DA70785